MLNSREECLATDRSATLASMVNLAKVYRDQKRWESEEELYTQVLQHWPTTSGETDTYIIARVALTRIRYDQGRLDEAEEMMIQTVEMGQRALGARHPGMTRAMFLLALVLKAKHRDKEALVLMVKCSSHGKHTYGYKHPYCTQIATKVRQWTAELAETGDPEIALASDEDQGVEM